MAEIPSGEKSRKSCGTGREPFSGRAKPSQSILPTRERSSGRLGHLSQADWGEDRRLGQWSGYDPRDPSCFDF